MPERSAATTNKSRKASGGTEGRGALRARVTPGVTTGVTTSVSQGVPQGMPQGVPPGDHAQVATLAGLGPSPEAGLAGALASAGGVQRAQIVGSLQGLCGNAFVQRMVDQGSLEDRGDRGDRGDPGAALALQRGKKGAGNAEQEAADAERLNQLTVDGVLAFETLGGFYPQDVDTVPEIAAEAPAGLRPALGHLQRAKQYRFGLAMPDAASTVQQALAKKGPIAGLGQWLLNGEVLVLQEKLSRAQTAKVEWQQARPALNAVVTRYAGLEGTNPEYAATLKGLVGRLDTQMTERVASLHLEIEGAASPEYAEIVTAVAEAKQASGVMEQLIESAEPFLTAGDTAKTANEAEALGPLANAAALEGALEAHGKLKTLIDLYESPDAIAGALGKMAGLKPGPEGLGVAMKGTFDIAKTLADQVKDTGALVVRGVADAYSGYASYLAAASPQDIVVRARAAGITKRANDLRAFAGRLEQLGKLTAVLGALSGAIGFVQGISENDFEQTMEGVVGVGEGIAGLALEGAAGAAASVGLLQLQGMVHVVSEMSRARQAIENAAIGSVVEDLEGELNAAATHARQFDVAIAEWVWRQNAADAVEKELGHQYFKRASAQVKPTQAGLARALQSATRGRLSKYGVLADTFTAAFGGADVATATMLDLARAPDLESPARLLSQATYLDGVLGNVAKAVGDLAITLKALRAGAGAGGKVKWHQQRHNTLKVATEVTFGDGKYSIAYRPGAMELEGPIDDESYREWLTQQLRGKALGDVTPLIHLEIEADVLGETITMAGSNSALARHSAIPAEAAAAIAGQMAARDGETAVDEKTSARALWRSHLQHVSVPEAHTFE